MTGAWVRGWVARRARWAVAALGCGAALAVCAPAAAQAPGTLDKSFGANGIATVPVAGDGGANSVAVQPDGKIVVAGQTSWHLSQAFEVARFNPDGSIDRSFGGDGHVRVPVGGASLAAHVRVQGDGKLVLSGTAYTGGSLKFAVVRLRPDGSLDPGFGNGGVVVQGVGQQALAVSSVPAANGKIVVGGTAQTGDAAVANKVENNAFAAIRLHGDGRLDTGFGDGGAVIGPGPTSAYAFVSQPGEGYVWVGETVTASGARAFAAARIRPGGSVDLGFGDGGMTTVPIGAGAGATGVAVEPNGDLTLVGAAFTNTFVTAAARLTEDGSLDTGWGSGGVATAFTGGSAPNSVVRQPDGRLVLPATNGLTAIRLDPDGSLDQTFGQGGVSRTPAGDRAAANWAALDREGRIILGGAVITGSTGSLAAARLYSGLPGSRRAR